MVSKKSSLCPSLRGILICCISILLLCMSYLLLSAMAVDQDVLHNNNNPNNLRRDILTSPPIEDTSSAKVVQSNRPHQQGKKVIAYAITVTKDSQFIDGALVLGYAAKKIHSSPYHSIYDVALVAFVAPSVTTSRPILEAYGWRVLERPLPVALDEIQDQAYMQKMKDSGCCGADEFLKLWAYTLTEYHRVVHLDMDSIVFKNMDEIYNIDKEMLFTGDYNMKSGSPVVPAQGGFLVVRPSMERFEEFRAIIRKGDHGPRGWGGTGKQTHTLPLKGLSIPTRRRISSLLKNDVEAE